MTRRRFEQIEEHKQRKQTLEAKLAKAEANRQKVLAEKVEKAKVLTQAERFVELPISQEDSKQKPEEMIDSCEIKQPVQAFKTEHQTQPTSLKLSQDFLSRKSTIVKPKAVGWVISRKTAKEKKTNVLDPQTDSDDDGMGWEKV